MSKRFKKLTSVLAGIAMMAIMCTGAVANETKAPSSLPDQTTERKLIIHKYSPKSESDAKGTGEAAEIKDKTPLENVEFDIYKAASLEKISTGEVKLAEKPSDADITKYAVAGNKVATVKTDKNGEATFTPSKEDGKYVDYVYLVVEKDNPAVKAKADPFFVSVPCTNPDGNGWLYTVNVYPKNDVIGTPHVDKDVNAIGNKHSGVDLNKEFSWIIRGDVPADLYYTDSQGKPVYAKEYKFTDTFDPRVDYVSSEVKLSQKDGNEAVIDAKYYDITEPQNTDGNRTLTIKLNNEGMKYIAENLGTGDKKAEIRVYVKARLNATAEMGTEVPNDVTLDYTNSTGTKYEPQTPEKKPEVHTGGLKILKYDSASKTTYLKGAEFKLAASNEDAKNGNYLKDAAGNEITITTDENGKAEYKGLAYDSEKGGTTYYLVETKAPEGYRLLNNAIVVTVNKDSYKADVVTIEVPNSKKFVLPVTGGMSAVIFVIIGAALIGGAVVINRYQKKTAK